MQDKNYYIALLHKHSNRSGEKLLHLMDEYNVNNLRMITVQEIKEFCKAQKINILERFEMIKTENECVGCTGMGIHCIGTACRYHGDFKVLVCDKCEEEADILYKYDGEELCEECLLDTIDKITYDDIESGE